MKEIYKDKKNANIHQFIANLPEQYETNVGPKDTQLFGGENKRISKKISYFLTKKKFYYLMN